MRKLKIAPNTTVMNLKEVQKFLKTKDVYSSSVNWIEKWKNPIFKKNGKFDYFPYRGFTIKKGIKLKRHSYYTGNNSFDWETQSGKSIFSLRRFVIKESKGKFFVTKV